jgi:hypothetical protein
MSARDLAEEYAGRCGKLTADLVGVEISLRVALEECKTEDRLRRSLRETLTTLQIAIETDKATRKQLEAA